MGILKTMLDSHLTHNTRVIRPLTKIRKHISFIEKENDAGVQENLTVGDHIKQLEGCLWLEMK